MHRIKTSTICIAMIIISSNYVTFCYVVFMLNLLSGSLSHVKLLDCFVIPVLMILSRWFLKTRYRIVHYVAVCICLLGVGAMVGADLLTGREQGSSK